MLTVHNVHQFTVHIVQKKNCLSIRYNNLLSKPFHLSVQLHRTNQFDYSLDNLDHQDHVSLGTQTSNDQHLCRHLVSGTAALGRAVSRAVPLPAEATTVAATTTAATW